MCLQPGRASNSWCGRLGEADGTCPASPLVGGGSNPLDDLERPNPAGVQLAGSR